MAGKIHWHGYRDIGGGYMPDAVETFETKKYAEEWLREEREYFWEARNESLTELRVEGSVRSGFFRLYDPAPLSAYERRAYIEPHDDATCEALGHDYGYP